MAVRMSGLLRACARIRPSPRPRVPHGAQCVATPSTVHQSNSPQTWPGTDRSEWITRTYLHAAIGVISTGMSPASVQAFASTNISHDPSTWRMRVEAVTGADAELLSDVLLGFGAQSVVVNEHRPEGAAEQEIFDDGTNQDELWDLCTVEAYFPIEHEMGEVQGLVRDMLGEDVSMQLEEVIPQEWIDTIKASYVPLQIADKVWIIPEWSEPVDASATNIVLQPGVAFGTGEHPTTRLCLQHLLSIDLESRTLMDYGCGSGVLALGALLKGASAAVGVDADPLAVRATLRNAQLNGLTDRLQALVCGPELSDPEPLAAAGLQQRQFDLVVANILRGPLLELRPRLTAYTRPGGQLVLSGVLTQQAADIAAAYSEDFNNFETRSSEGWAVLTATRKE